MLLKNETYAPDAGNGVHAVVRPQEGQAADTESWVHGDVKACTNVLATSFLRLCVQKQAGT